MKFSELPIGTVFVFTSPHTRSAKFRKVSATTYERLEDFVVERVTAQAGTLHACFNLDSGVEPAVTHKRPEDLSRKQLAKLVRSIWVTLYFDEHGDHDPDKQWSPDTPDEIGDAMDRAGLRPDAVNHKSNE